MTWINVPSSESEAVAVANIYKNEERDALFKNHLLLITVGQKVKLLKKKDDWYYGYVQNVPKVCGVVPNNHLHVVEVRDEKPLIHEVHAVLLEWNAVWKQRYIENRSMDSDYGEIKQQMYNLINHCKSLFYSKQTQEQLKELENKVKEIIDLGNSRLKLDLVVRDDDGCTLDPEQTSVITLLRRHRFSDRNIKITRISSDVVKPNAGINLKVEMRAANCKVADNYDISMFLYDINTEKCISENFIMKYNSTSSSQSMDKISNTIGLFTDLGLEDSRRNKVALVFLIIRVGRMESKFSSDSRKGLKEIKRDNTKDMRRPFGVAALDVTDIIGDGSPVEKLVPYIPWGDHEFLAQIIPKAVQYKDGSGKDKKDMTSSVASSSSVTSSTSASHFRDGSNSKNSSGQGIHINVQKITGDLFQKKDQLMVSQSSATARKIGFPDVILPTYVRNEIHITLLHAVLAKPAGKSDGNIEVTMTVCDKMGKVMKKAISEGANVDMVDEYRSIVYYHELRPKWHETVKVDIDADQFHQAHLKFTIKHRASSDAKDKISKPHAFAFVKLMNENGTTIRNSKHELRVYKWPSVNNAEYLKYPSDIAKDRVQAQNATNDYSHYAKHMSSNDSITIESTVVSTKLTHNVNLMAILKSYKLESPAELKVNLESVINMDGHEVLKFLTDILDALFNILKDKNTNLDEEVFNALVFVVSLVSTDKYSQFRNVLNNYIDEQFSYTLAYNNLLRVLISLLDTAVRCKNNSNALVNALSSLEYMFKFIVKSRQLFISFPSQSSGNEAFVNSIYSVFKLISALMRESHPSVKRIQVNCLKYLPDTLTNIISVIEPTKISQIFVEFLNSIPNKNFVLEKLNCIRMLVGNIIFQNADCRHLLLPTFIEYITDKLEDERYAEKCVQILADVMDVLFSCEEADKYEDIQNIVKNMRNVTMALIRKLIAGEYQKADTTTAVILSILRQVSENHYKQHILDINNTYDILDEMGEMQIVIKDLISRPVFSSDWSEMILLQNSIFLKALRYFSGTIKEYFTKIFRYEIWNNYFETMISFVCQDCLQLESFSDSKKSRIISRYKDMRREAAFDVVSMWFHLHTNKMAFIPDMIGRLLEMTLIPEPQLRVETIKIFYDIMYCEFTSSQPGANRDAIKGNFFKFEKEMIIKIDAMVGSGKGDDDYRIVFSKILNGYFDNVIDIPDTLKVLGKTCVQTIDNQLLLLLEYREAKNHDSLDNRMNAIMNIMNFYRTIKRNELYLRYLNKLCSLHLDNNNFEEAAYTLLGFADMLTWSKAPLDYLASEKYPKCHTHEELKEQLYTEIIGYLNKARMWFKSIEISKELQTQYEYNTYDYEKVADIMSQISTMYKHILVKPDHPSFFRICFFGKGFPSFIRNKKFIYRDLNLSSLLDYNGIMQQQFPKAKFVMNLNDKDLEEYKLSESQYILLNAVNTSSVLPESLEGKDVNLEVSIYYKYNEVSNFHYKTNSGESTKMMSLKTIQHNIKTQTTLPGMLRWSEIIEESMVELEPIDYAIYLIEDKNENILRDLRLLVNDVQPLGSILIGVVNAVVNGGIAVYKDFYTDEYEESHNTQEDMEKINKLRNATKCQLALLSIGVNAYAQRMDPVLHPFYENLASQFTMFKKLLVSEYGIQLTEEFLYKIKSSTRIGKSKKHREINSISDTSATITRTNSNASQINTNTTKTPRRFTRTLPAGDMMSVKDSTPSPRNSLSSISGSISENSEHSTPTSTRHYTNPGMQYPVIARKPQPQSQLQSHQSAPHTGLQTSTPMTPQALTRVPPTLRSYSVNAVPPPLPKKESKQRLTLTNSGDTLC